MKRFYARLPGIRRQLAYPPFIFPYTSRNHASLTIEFEEYVVRKSYEVMAYLREYLVVTRFLTFLRATVSLSVPNT